ncbi:MAG TPA: hypothetical protein DEP69_02790, partial [Acidimicrobiaceae bacterium]|nr:hypothetical protein [Acidimicrobiaceae bacterium]
MRCARRIWRDNEPAVTAPPAAPPVVPPAAPPVVPPVVPIVAVGSDHAGYELKEVLAAHLRAAGREVVDFGTDGAAAVDYP